jgi:hypothetical protein
LAEKKRVIVVDTSNEIAGDGDIPHPAIGRARRMQVATPSFQHEVMIEAVENHMPEVVIIDEIGRELEAEAARTIAERGVQLVGTAHGNTLDNLLMNPTLCDLVGGIDSVTLSDEEARRRGTQKTVLERRAPPTFDVLVEIQDRQTVALHPDVARAVDAFLRGRPMSAEIRYRDEQGKIQVETTTVKKREPIEAPSLPERLEPDDLPPSRKKTVRLYPYGISQNRLRQAASNLQLPMRLVDDVHKANALMTLKSFYRKRPQPVAEAERLGVPVYVLRSNTLNQIYVLRSNTLNQMESSLADIFELSPEETDPFSSAMREAQEAIRKVRMGARSVELSPQASSIRRYQHEMARRYDLISHSRGREPRRRVRIYREQ